MRKIARHPHLPNESVNYKRGAPFMYSCVLYAIFVENSAREFILFNHQWHETLYICTIYLNMLNVYNMLM